MSGSLANTQMLGLSQHGFTNEQIAEDLGYDTDVVDLVIPKEDDGRTVAERFESLGDVAYNCIKELAMFGEHEQTRLNAAKYIYDKIEVKDKTRTALDLAAFSSRLQQARNQMKDVVKV